MENTMTLEQIAAVTGRSYRTVRSWALAASRGVLYTRGATVTPLGATVTPLEVKQSLTDKLAAARGTGQTQHFTALEVGAILRAGNQPALADILERETVVSRNLATCTNPSPDDVRSILSAELSAFTNKLAEIVSSALSSHLTTPAALPAPKITAERIEQILMARAEREGRTIRNMWAYLYRAARWRKLKLFVDRSTDHDERDALYRSTGDELQALYDIVMTLPTDFTAHDETVRMLEDRRNNKMRQGFWDRD